MDSNIRFKKIALEDFEIDSRLKSIFENKGSMTKLLENLFNKVYIEIINQNKNITSDSSYYIYRHILIKSNKINLMNAISFISDGFFELLHIESNNFLEKEFLGKLIFDESTNKLNFGLLRSEFTYGLIDNKMTRMSEFYYNNLSLIKLYESFMPEFFLHFK
tara:strand:- start:5224 stop:5709 length:486 start_codon:yes stop_codon:yes gene_type:complete